MITPLLRALLGAYCESVIQASCGFVCACAEGNKKENDTCPSRATQVGLSAPHTSSKNQRSGTIQEAWEGLQVQHLGLSSGNSEPLPFLPGSPSTRLPRITIASTTYCFRQKFTNLPGLTLVFRLHIGAPSRGFSQTFFFYLFVSPQCLRHS